MAHSPKARDTILGTKAKSLLSVASSTVAVALVALAQTGMLEAPLLWSALVAAIGGLVFGYLVKRESARDWRRVPGGRLAYLGMFLAWVALFFLLQIAAVMYGLSIGLTPDQIADW